jgi:hypothetical protein
MPLRLDDLEGQVARQRNATVRFIMELQTITAASASGALHF